MSQNKNKAVKTSLISMFGNAALAIIKMTAGIIGNSFALIADGIESITDIFASFIVFLGLKYANKSPDDNHPYGHGKAEPLVTFIVVGFLLVSATIIAVKSIDNIFSPQEAPKPFTLIVLAAIIIIKETFYRFVNKKSNETHSSSLKADAWHHRSDAITSMMAFVGIIISIYFGPGFEAAEDYAAIVASIVIIYNAYRIFRPALGEIMDEHMYDELVEEIKAFSLKTNGVLDTEKCRVRKSGMAYFVDLHVIVSGQNSVQEGHFIGHELKDALIKQFPQILDILVHIEPDEHL
jgi:cation diffusion facilitator family transporter